MSRTGNAVDRVLEIAREIGVEFVTNDDFMPSVYYEFDGFGNDKKPPDWRELVGAQNKRLSWECPYTQVEP